MTTKWLSLVGQRPIYTIDLTVFTVLVIYVRLAVEFSRQSENLSEGMNTNPNPNKNLSHKWYLFLLAVIQNKHFWPALVGPQKCVSLYKPKIRFSSTTEIQIWIKISTISDIYFGDDEKTSSPIDQYGRTMVLTSHDVGQRFWYCWYWILSVYFTNELERLPYGKLWYLYLKKYEINLMKW